MTHVVTDACVKCKYTECVAVCPVNCFKEGANMLVIDPETCIDCGVCVIECPAKAIQADTEPNSEKWVALNKKLAQKWPTISDPKAPPPDADHWKNVPNKLPHLDENPFTPLQKKPPS